MYQAGCHVRWHRVFADAGYDAEHNHEFCRDVLGMKSSIIALNRRNMGRRWPLTKYRRQMKRTAYRRDYGQRWQVESVFSRYKRLFGAALRARTDASQAREMLLRVLVHNLMLLRRVACFQQSNVETKGHAVRYRTKLGDTVIETNIEQSGRRFKIETKKRRQTSVARRVTKDCYDNLTLTQMKTAIRKILPRYVTNGR